MDKKLPFQVLAEEKKVPNNKLFQTLIPRMSAASITGIGVRGKLAGGLVLV